MPSNSVTLCLIQSKLKAPTSTVYNHHLHHTNPVESAKLQLITIFPTKALKTLFFHLFNSNLFLMTLLSLNYGICLKVIKWLRRTPVTLIKKKEHQAFIGEVEVKEDLLLE